MGEHTSIFNRRTFLEGSAALCSAVALASAYPHVALATPTSAEKRAEAEAALEQLNAMQQQLDEASAKYFTAVEEHEEAKKKMEEAQKKIDEANARIAVLQGQLGTRARSMYRTGSLSFLDLLLGSTDFKSFTTNWDLLSDLNERDAEMVAETKELRAEVEEQKAIYAEQERIAAEKEAEAAAVKEEAEAMVADMQATYDALSEEAAQLLAEEEAAREAALALQAEEQLRQENDNPDAEPSTEEDQANNSKPQSVTGNVVVDRAYSQIGKPYEWAACGPDTFDCSGFVSYCLSGSYGVRLGTTYTFMGWTRVTNPQPGDICTNWTHCGVYIGGGQMIHAPYTGATICVAGVRSNMIYVRY